MSENLKRTIKEKFEADLKAKEEKRKVDISNTQIFEEEISQKEIFYKERESFCQDKDGYKKIINNIGEEEWISEEDLKKRDGYLNFEEDMDDAIVHQKRLLKRYLFVSLLLILISLAGISYFVKNEGFIEVNSNRVGVKIFMDNELIGLTSDKVTTIEKVVTGNHVIKLEKLGFKITPDSLVVDVFKSEAGNPTPTIVTFEIDSIKVKQVKID
jgi:hypothetical protein